MTATKGQRHRAILDLVNRGAAHTQQDIALALARRGLHATQATVSRDIQELGLVRSGSGYRSPAAMVRELVLSVEVVEPMAVIRTPPGTANLVARALPESCHPPRRLKRSIFLTLFVALELQAESSIPVSVRTTPPLPVSRGRQPDVRVAGSTKPAILLLEITVNGLPLSGVIRVERMNGNRLVLPAADFDETTAAPRTVTPLTTDT